jgi:translation elongation factor P/translation initiation factor 5A
VSIHKTTHYMSQAMGGTFTTFTVIWFADGESQSKTFTSERSAIAFKIEQEHEVTT